MKINRLILNYCLNNIIKIIIVIIELSNLLLYPIIIIIIIELSIMIDLNYIII